MKIRILVWLMSGLLLPLTAWTQSADKAPDNWHHLDSRQDGFNGISTEQMYQFLKGRTPQTVVVAVIDSGVDCEHEDLKDVIWVNEDEIPDNGRDDDGNGYVDDVHGWNFIGGKDGKNVHFDQLELTRLYVHYRKKFEGKDPETLKKKERKEYERYKDLEKKLHEKQEEMKGNVELYGGIRDALDDLAQKIGKEDISLDDLENFETDDSRLSRAAAILTNVLSRGGSLQELRDNLQEAYDYCNNQLLYYYNPDYDPRPIVGDNYEDSSERYYGNNDVEGPDASHGTHVAGIIAAVRNNGIGMDGIADKVRIMSVRTVPDGDERDKDVANAIRYAVDNGAQIINMSFGKGYAWDKDVVDKAVKYAMKHDVLLVHAAGNSGQDNDSNDNFPNDSFRKKGLFGPKKAKNWLEVGALSWKKGEDLPAGFSNYGKENVDLFAPGVDIYSTIPDNKYAHFNGTSMASPTVAGIAAVIRSYFPELSAEQVREAILQSVRKENVKVKKPGTEELVPFSSLSATGGIANGYEAVRVASQMKGKKKKVKRAGADGSAPKPKKARKKVAVP